MGCHAYLNNELYFDNSTIPSNFRENNSEPLKIASSIEVSPLWRSGLRFSIVMYGCMKPAIYAPYIEVSALWRSGLLVLLCMAV